MSNANDIAPVITYVTDADLDITSQKGVLSAFSEHARSFPIRVAFRLPRWRDDAVADLINWCLDLVERDGFINHPLPIVIHDRPELAAAYPSSVLWLPWRNRKQSELNEDQPTALSVHSVEEAQEAAESGVSEIVFGHVFESESHPGQQGRGVTAAVEVANSVEGFSRPPIVTVIGGVRPDTIYELGRHNLGNVAAIRAISRSHNIGPTMDQMVFYWKAGRAQGEHVVSATTPANHVS